MAKQKYYVVWVGRNTGIFNNWPAVQASVTKFAGAKHKSFATLAEAETAFSGTPAQTNVSSALPVKNKTTASHALPSSRLDSNFDIHIFCDGGCDPNPGKAASGVVVYESGELSKMYHGLYEPDGTNNTAELNALHQAMLIAESKLEDKLKVQILSDSKYSVNSMTSWGAGWKRSGRMAGKGKYLANRELIAEMYELYEKIAKHIDVIHVKAHIGIEGNELADRMCTLAIQEKVTGFEAYSGLGVNALLALGNS